LPYLEGDFGHSFLIVILRGNEAGVLSCIFAQPTQLNFRPRFWIQREVKQAHFGRLWRLAAVRSSITARDLGDAAAVKPDGCTPLGALVTPAPVEGGQPRRSSSPGRSSQ